MSRSHRVRPSVGRFAVLCFTLCLPLLFPTRIYAEVEVSREASALPVYAPGMPLPTALYNKESVDSLRPSSSDSPSRRRRASVRDTLSAPIDTVRLSSVTDSIARRADVPLALRPRFVPKPSRALWLSLVFPGAGQIYNRKYWKLPIIYGGFLGCAYALMWNQQMYLDYSQAYLDIMDDDPRTTSYLDMLPPRYDMTGKEERYQKVFKRKKDFYRRNRDLSAFCFVGVYLLSVIDAYVDAQLSDFDITPDLSLSVNPAVLPGQSVLGGRGDNAYGIGFGLRF